MWFPGLTLKELLQLSLVHIMGYIPDEELLAVWVPDCSPRLHLALLAVPHCKNGQGEVWPRCLNSGTVTMLVTSLVTTLQACEGK